MTHDRFERRLPVGAEVVPGGVHFRVWAPSRKKVEVVLEGESGGISLRRESSGHFSGLVAQAHAGSRYKLRLDGADAFPDPVSRFQPDGPHGPSEVIDPREFRWTDQGWQGVRLAGQVIYEMHIGTFSAEGSFEGALKHLPALAETGITVLEVMPVADFPGTFGWGYDGVDLFAPTHLYGRPDDFRRFVDTAHALGMGVILDVVYNHLGPDGNYLPQFSPLYFSEAIHTDWGSAINYDGPGSEGAREFYIANAGYWIDEFHLDGLRLDATQDIHDNSKDHVLAAIAREVRRKASPRSAIIVAENEPQDNRLIRAPEDGGYGLDALWNDDFHHSAMVALTGKNEAYYTDYLGKPQEFISASKYGYLYQGQYYEWQKKRRGTPRLHLPAASMIQFIQNHDQVANSARGLRCSALTDPGRLRAMTALLLLMPGTPMLFQGQEFAASSPFLFFADHQPELAALVHAGRIEFLSQFRSIATPGMQGCVVNPADLSTFTRCKIDHEERERHAEIYALHRDLLRLRRTDPVLTSEAPGKIDGAVLGPEAFVLRFFGANGHDRLLVVNLGTDLHLRPAPEPLLAPPEGLAWSTRWSSEDPKYGGRGTAPLDTDENWRIPGHAAVVFAPEAVDE